MFGRFLKIEICIFNHLNMCIVTSVVASGVSDPLVDVSGLLKPSAIPCYKTKYANNYGQYFWATPASTR